MKFKLSVLFIILSFSCSDDFQSSQFCNPNQEFNREFSVINTMYVSGGSGDPGYNSQVGMLSSYPLSGYNSTWGWALHNTATGSEIAKYYNFYEY